MFQVNFDFSYGHTGMQIAVLALWHSAGFYASIYTF